MDFFEDKSEKKDNSNHYLWVEKYRPTVISEYVGDDYIKSKVLDYINGNTVDNLLLFGKPGTGKTTLAKIIVNSLKCDYLYVNASDENSVDDVRTKIKDYTMTLGFSELKVVILDESDYLSINAQAALRNIIESCSKYTRFILTANYIEKIIEPLISRCNTVEIKPPSKSDIGVHLCKICKSENITFEMPDLKILIDKNYPDIRKIIKSR